MVKTKNRFALVGAKRFFVRLTSLAQLQSNRAALKQAASNLTAQRAVSLRPIYFCVLHKSPYENIPDLLSSLRRWRIIFFSRREIYDWLIPRMSATSF